VGVDDLSKEEVLEKINSWLVTSHQSLVTSKLVFTPGPEFLLTAQKDKEFENILNSADLTPNESFGLQLYCGFKNRVPGVDLVLELCRLAEKNGWSVGMMGNPNTQAAAKKLLEMFPKLKIGFAVDNPTTDRLVEVCDIQSYVDILFVGVGHPKQEKFLNNCKLAPIKSGLKISNLKFRVGMGVGGSFDLISGKFPRPPIVLRNLGLEWLWRGVTKRGHFARILRASLGFPLFYFLSKIS
ncbi:WecB/TagA/CpsF family glycosyltransferase, partial [Candidatus Microgenomates bacterium]|nr:WecB/TagA/CpsF family glycosyltransferase [Candidatus Microgenomates bacterium]